MSVKSNLNIGVYRHPNPEHWFELINNTVIATDYSKLSLEDLIWLRDEPVPNLLNYTTKDGFSYNPVYNWKLAFESEITFRRISNLKSNHKTVSVCNMLCQY